MIEILQGLLSKANTRLSTADGACAHTQLIGASADRQEYWRGFKTSVLRSIEDIEQAISDVRSSEGS